MNKVTGPIRHISTVLVIFIFILTAAYFAFLHYFGQFFPFPTFLEIKHSYTIVLAISPLVLLPTAYFSSFPTIVRIVFLTLAIPLCCMLSFLAFDLDERILDTAEFGNHRYYAIGQVPLFKSAHTLYSIYRCNVEGLFCEQIYTNRGGDVMDDVDLIADEQTYEMQVWRNGFLTYVDGVQPREILADEQFGSYVYYIGVYPTYGSSSDKYTYMLYQCQSSFTLCRQLPFRYTDTGGSFKLKFDNSAQELLVYKWGYDLDDVLIFSLGAEPKCYVERCTIPNQ